jgi:hypothetical protein
MTCIRYVSVQKIDHLPSILNEVILYFPDKCNQILL